MKGKILEGAKWIWLDPVTYPQFQTSAYTLFCEKMPYCVAHFRKKIWLNDVPMSVKTAVSADCKYILRVNGETVSRGPAIVGGDYGNTQPLGYRFYDFPSVRFCRGENEIDAFVLLEPTVESDYSDGHGGFLFASELTFPGGENLRILSDESWLAWRDERFTADYQTDLTLTSCAEIPAILYCKYHKGWRCCLLSEQDALKIKMHTIIMIIRQSMNQQRILSAFTVQMKD